MRKWETYMNMNRNSTVVNHFHPNEDTNPGIPNILVGQLWMQNENTQMEIIELDSNDSEINTEEEQDFNFGEIWNYLDKERFSVPQPEVYKANQKARAERRMRYCNDSQGENSPDTFENDMADGVNELIYSRSFGFSNDISDRNNNKNHQSNCFTIINKSFTTPDSSSDDVEFMERLNTSQHSNDALAPCEGDIMSFEEDIDSTKNMIWIYSFKNKRDLSEHDFELVNIPSHDSSSSTSCSLENSCDESTKTKKGRVSSPIPATFVPRLNLSAATTLPTVTEIAEPTKRDRAPSTRYVNNDLAATNHFNILQKPINNWLEKDEKRETDKQDKSSSANVINWMCLSPRERRRRFKHTNTSPTYGPRLPVLVEVPSAEPKSHVSIIKGEPKIIQVTAEINTVTNESKSSSNTQITVADIVDMDENDSFTKKNIKTPQIIFDRDRSKITTITDPMEKLNTSNWIHEETKREEIQKATDYKQPEIIEIKNSTPKKPDYECAGQKLLMRNMSLLKPADWKEFLPITESVPSLHLSIDSSDRSKPSWLKRLRTCFKCIK